MFDLPITEFPAMVQTALVAVVGVKETYHEMDLGEVAREFDRLHPYGFCKKHNLLVDNSGEEFAIQFMTYYNNNVGPRY